MSAIAWPRASSLGLLLLLLVGTLLRLQGLDWDQGQHLHPDERFLSMVAADVRPPRSVAEYFDTSRSPLNPANVGRGFFVYGTFPLFFVKAAGALTGLRDYDQIYRVGRASSAAFDVGTIALTYALGLLLAGPLAAFSAAALMTFSVASIQQAHFFTVDSFATFFVTASLLCLAKLALSTRVRWHVLFGAAFGLTLACRANLLLLGLIYPLILVYVGTRRPVRLRTLAGGIVLAVLATAAVFRVFQPYAFAGPGVFDVGFAREFLHSLDSIRGYVTGAVDYPPSVQWIGRLPILFAGKNLLLWGMGPAWGLAALVALPWCLAPSRGILPGRMAAPLRILCVWAPLLFLFHAAQFAATVRYFLPLLPTLALAVAVLFTSGSAPAVRKALLTTIIVCTALWAAAFTSVYRHPHTRLDASRWIFQNVPAGATIATEHWDDGLPVGLDGRHSREYSRVELKLYDEENEAKRQELLGTLDRADVIVISSNRLYGSIPRAPWRYPLARRYYELLFSGELGFGLERVFASYPRLGPFEIDDSAAEEAFTVFDHPKVLIFRKTPQYSTARATDLLESVSLAGLVRVPPREASRLYRQSHPSDVALPNGAAQRRQEQIAAPGSVSALVRWFVALELLSLAAFALLAGPLVMARDRGYALAKLIAWVGPGTLVWLVASTGLGTNSVGTARAAATLLVLGGVVVAWRSRDDLRAFISSEWRRLLLIEGVFCAAFVLIVAVRAWNPAIFWGEKPMDFAILNATLRGVTLPPADPWFAGARLNYFYFGHALVAIFSNISGVAPAFAFNLAMPTIAAMLAALVCALAVQTTGRAAVGPWAAVLIVVAGNLAGLRTFLLHAPPHLGFDYFWSTSRVIAGTINEFPLWNLSFGDLHAHVLAMPLQAGILYVGCLWQTDRRGGAYGRTLLLAGLGAWFIGALATTSSWSFPPFAGLWLGCLLTPLAWEQRWLRRLLAAVLTWGTIVAAAFILFLPFWSAYVPSGLVWGAVRGEGASLADAVTIFGVFLLLVLPALATSVYRWAARDRWRIAVLVLSAVVVTALARWRSGASALYAGLLVLALLMWLTDRRPAARVGALLVSCACILGIATEFVFIWDRMNTVFKYYLDMWLMLGAAAAILMAVTWEETAAKWRPACLTGMVAVTLAGLFTSATGVVGFLREPRAASAVPTLDGMNYLRSSSPDELAAFEWLNREVRGIPVVLEAHGPTYQAFGRVSMNTGLPTVLGWDYHLFQQGRPRDQLEVRAADVRRIYEASSPGDVERLLAAYHVDFVFVGPIERRTYTAAGLSRFAASTRLETVFRNEGVTIYASKGQARTVKSWVDAVPQRAPEVAVDAPLREPRGIAAAPDGTLAVADFGNRRVQRLGPDLRPVGAFGRQGDGPVEFRDPCGIAVDAEGHIWVADTWNHRLLEFSPGGEPLAELRAELYGPRGIAIARDGQLYVTDTGNRRVVRFTPSGESQVVVRPGVLDNPIGIAVNAEGELFVADEGHRRVTVFDKDGRLLREWPVPWREHPRGEPYLAVDPSGAVWVTDPAGGQVLIFERDGRPLGTATAAEALELPLGIAMLDSAHGVVADAASGRVIPIARPGHAPAQGAGGGAASGGSTASNGTERLQTPTRKSSAR